jgi:dephospho-CoA kinase
MRGRHVSGRKLIIGLAGGIGSGKSTVARILQELGAAVISSDELNREELARPEVLGELREWWGEKVIGPDGRPNRTAIRAIISADPQARTRLESLLHPRIDQRRRELTAGYRADPAIRAIVWDSPLLFEAGLARECDTVIFVDADRELRARRVAQERGWTLQELGRLEKAQNALDFKKNSADHRVTNNSDMDGLRCEVRAVFSRILSGAEEPR